MNPIPILADHLTHARLALFLGADLPQAITGLPGRTNLARGLAQRKSLDETLSLAAVAQRVMQAGNRFEFTDYLGRQLETVGKPPQRFHQLVVQLPVQTIITTAYDNLLELAFQQAGAPINHLVRDSDLAFVDPRRRTLIKLYGDLQQRDTLVVTEDDQYGLWRNRDKEGLLNRVRDLLSSNAVLFLGYDLADPDFKLLWREVLDRMGRFASGAYAAWPGLPADERRVWEQRQVRIIDEQPLALLEQLVAAVTGQELSAPAPAPAAPTMVRSAVPQQEPQPMNAEQRRHLETLRHDHQRRLDVLERQAAQFGVHVPPHIVIEIEDIQAAIAAIDQQIAAASSDTSTLPSSLVPAARTPATPIATPGSMQRCTDLAASVREILELIKEYEDQRRLADDPKTRRRAEREIADLRAQLAGYEREQRELGCV